MGAPTIRIDQCSRGTKRPKIPKKDAIPVDDMLTHGNCIEADFQREYAIDLSMSVISWRRFVALLGALSADSVFNNVLHNQQKNKPIEDPDAIMADIAAQFRGKKG